MSRSSRLAALAALVATVTLAAPSRAAADLADIGYVDQAALSAIPSFQAANRQLNDYGRRLQRDYEGRARKKPAAEQERLAVEFRGKVSDQQRRLFGPLFAKAQVAIASIASSKNLSVVIDKQIVVFGGTDITNNVRDLLSGVGDPVPPVNTPPPSTVGYVDQSQIDNVPKIKAATDDFAKFKAEQDKTTGEKMKGAKNDADRNTVLKDYQKTLEDKQKAVLQPMIDSTRTAMSNVAKKRGLALVVSRSNVIYGGTDITADVVTSLK